MMGHEMAQWVKTLSTNPDNPGTWWKERNNSWKLSSGFSVCAMRCTQTHTLNKCNKNALCEHLKEQGDLRVSYPTGPMDCSCMGAHSMGGEWRDRYMAEHSPNTKRCPSRHWADSSVDKLLTVQASRPEFTSLGPQGSLPRKGACHQNLSSIPRTDTVEKENCFLKVVL